MKKYLILFTLMLLAFSYSYSTVMPETDWSNKKLKGKVKSMTEITYNYGYSGKDNEVKKKTIKFNENGYIMEELQYDKNKKEPYSYKYEYDEKGLLVVSNEYVYSYEYDKEENLVQSKKKKVGTYGGIEKTIYNKEGKKIRVQTYTQNQYDKTGVKISDDSKYLKDKNGDLYQSLSDYLYIYNKDGKLQEVRDNVNSSGTIKYTYKTENGLYVETAELVTQKFVTYYDKDDNEVYYMWVTQPSSQFEPKIQLYLAFKNRKKDKYGNITYQEANRIKVIDISTGKGEDMGLYEKKVIEYEYYK